MTAPPVTAILCRTFYYTALAAVLTPAFAFPLIGNTLSGLSRPSYVMLGRNMGLSILFPHCLCGLCGAFTKLISCRIYHTHRKISPAAPLYDEWQHTRACSSFWDPNSKKELRNSTSFFLEERSYPPAVLACWTAARHSPHMQRVISLVCCHLFDMARYPRWSTWGPDRRFSARISATARWADSDAWICRLKQGDDVQVFGGYFQPCICFLRKQNDSMCNHICTTYFIKSFMLCLVQERAAFRLLL